MATIPEALTLALAHHQAGRLLAAEQIYRQVLQVEPNQPDALHLLGMIAYAAGKLEIAAQYMTTAVQVRPDLAEAHSNLGVALADQGKWDEAMACYHRALALKPDFVEAHTNLGNALKNLGKLDQAVASYRRALTRNPDYVEAHNNLGIALRELGKSEEAAASFKRALHVRPDFAQAHYNLGIALKDEGKLEEAADCWRRALHLKPDYAEAHNNLGIALSDQGKLDEAIACYRQTLALRPDYAEGHNNLGNALKDLGKLDEAVSCYRRALELKPDYAEAHNNLGIALREQGKVDDTIACCHRALELKPDLADAHSNLGVALSDQGKLDQAAASYRRALALNPGCADAHWNQSLLNLLKGDYEHGWPEYEWRWQTKQLRFQRRHFAQPLWDGRPLAGKTILLHAEQGLGDTIQFVRYVSLVKEHGGRVVLECQPALMALVANFPGIDELVAQGGPLPAFDVQAPLLSLPGLLGTTRETIPVRVPYLQADPELTQAWRQRLVPLGGVKVGIVWQGNPHVKGDYQRSIALRHYEPLAKVEGVRLVSLQKGPAAEELRTPPFPVLDLGSQLESFSDTAAVLKNLDLVISSCTSVPHLAGAMGVPAWLALAHVPDWRWFLEREDSPWYPHHRLFRQCQPGEWGKLFERIAEALRGLVESRES